jgi:hypothetical protein
MSKGKGGRKIGRLLIIGGVAAVGYYGYTKGWFKPVQDWIKSITGGQSTPTDPDDPTNPTNPGQDINIELPNIDLSGIDDFLDDAWEKLKDMFRNPSDQSVPEKVRDVVDSIVKPAAAAAGVSAAGLGTTATVAAAAQAPIAPALAASSSSALVRQFGKLAAAGTAVQLQAGLEALVPIILGTSPAVAAGVHSANVAITKALTDAGLYKEREQLELYDVIVPGSNTKRVIVSNSTGKVYDGQGNVLNISAAEIKATKKKTKTVTTILPSGVKKTTVVSA